MMRRERWSASKARDHVTQLRSLVCVNDGFWRSLCALEAPLGVTDRYCGGYGLNWNLTTVQGDVNGLEGTLMDLHCQAYIVLFCSDWPIEIYQ